MPRLADNVLSPGTLVRSLVGVAFGLVLIVTGRQPLLGALFVVLGAVFAWSAFGFRRPRRRRDRS